MRTNHLDKLSNVITDLFHEDNSNFQYFSIQLSNLNSELYVFY